MRSTIKMTLYFWSNLIVTFLLISTLEVSSQQDGQMENKKVVCYYTNWSSYRPGELAFFPKDINPSLCTHLIYAFLTFKEDLGGLAAFDSFQDIDRKGFQQFADLKSMNKDLKLLAAIGGWREGSKRFSAIARSEESRRTFAKGVIQFLRQYNFEGINIDWQYPAFREGSIDKDRNNFVELLKTLKDEFDAENTTLDKLLLTTSAPQNTEYIEKGFDLPEIQKYVEFITIVCYDYHLSTDLVVNHHSPLYALPQEVGDEAKLNVDWTVRFIIEHGVAREKIVLGIPAYGRTFTLMDENMHQIGSPSDGEGPEGVSTREIGYKAFYEICQDIIKEGWQVVHVNRTALGPYAHKGKNWVSFDDEDSARRKGEYAREQNLGGIMFWSIDDDDYTGRCGDRKYPLIQSAKEGFYSFSASMTTEDTTTTSSTPMPTRATRPVQMTTDQTVTPRLRSVSADTLSAGEDGIIENRPFLNSPPSGSHTVSREFKDHGNTFYQSISIWITNNVFHLG
ncbi:chitinase-like protein 4 [Cimex lectularius]|uniref:GH18 domain-containing protein n=1 Tax=Cimex lectularius TaxID=79782 RepID=A0A8I6RPU6_CIMLE|nr:chitinase-like protein 4 [Cimex lectularius]XP_014246009.1 chitinase-like protein 4 [Cimex lectularius]